MRLQPGEAPQHPTRAHDTRAAMLALRLALVASLAMAASAAYSARLDPGEEALSQAEDEKGKAKKGKKGGVRKEDSVAAFMSTG